MLALALAGSVEAQSPAAAPRMSTRDSLAQARIDSLRRAAAGPRRAVRPVATPSSSLDSLRRILAADSVRRVMVADSLRLARADSVARVRADSLARAVDDSLSRVRETQRALGRQRDRAVLRRFDQPRWVMLRSLVVPGWGQLHNRSWIKALLVAGVEVNMGRLVIDDVRALDRLEGRIDAARQIPDSLGGPGIVNQLVDDYNARLETLTRRQWWLGAAVAYALLDAYIDAHFRNFEAEFEYDPALPGGEPTARVRLSYRWRF